MTHRYSCWPFIRQLFVLLLFYTTVLPLLPPPLAVVMACPAPMCVCIWKGGKQTTECINKSMTDIPNGLDSGTQVLDFSGNNVRNLSAERFQNIGLVHLQKIFLARCRISRIDDNAFRGLANLVELDLSHNLLTAVPSATFGDYPSLMKLSLNGNPIRVVRTATFRALRYLNSLELNRCQLTLIETDAFAGLLNLEWLKLEHNLLKYIPGPNTLPRQLHGVYLQHNLWYCDCLLADLYRWLNAVNIPDASEAMCDGPQRLRGAPVKLLDENELACLPDVSPTSLYLEISEGKNVSLLCKVHAVPEAKISWWFKDRVLQNNSIISPGLHFYYYYLEESSIDISSSSSSSSSGNGHGTDKKSELFIYNTNQEDNGTFVCQAENQAGRFRSNYTIRIILKEEEERAFEDKKIPSEMILALCSMVFLSLVLLSVCLICFTVRYRSRRRKRLLRRKKEKTKELALYDEHQRTIAEHQRTMITDPIKLNGGLTQSHHHHGHHHGQHYFEATAPIPSCNVVEQTSSLFTYPTYSVVIPSIATAAATTEQNPDLISDTEKDRSNSQSGDDDEATDVVVVNNDTDDQHQKQKLENDRRNIPAALSPVAPLIVCINHLQPVADMHFNAADNSPGNGPILAVAAGYPADYGLPRIPPITQTSQFYRTLPHRRPNHLQQQHHNQQHHHANMSAATGLRYAREAEFASNLVLQQPPSYEHYKIGTDVRYNVQGYPPIDSPTATTTATTTTFHYPAPAARGVTFSDTVCVMVSGGGDNNDHRVRHQHVDIINNACKAVQVDDDPTKQQIEPNKNNNVSLVNASAQTVNASAQTVNGELLNFRAKNLSSCSVQEKSSAAAQSRFSFTNNNNNNNNNSNRNVLTESPDEGYVGETTE